MQSHNIQNCKSVTSVSIKTCYSLSYRPSTITLSIILLQLYQIKAMLMSSHFFLFLANLLSLDHNHQLQLNIRMINGALINEVKVLRMNSFL